MDQAKAVPSFRRRPWYKGGRCGGVISRPGVHAPEDKPSSKAVYPDEIRDDHLDPRFRKLMKEVISTAVLDLFSGVQHDRSSAEGFFLYDQSPPEPYSFPWLCEHLSFDPQEILKNVRRLQAEYIKYSPQRRYRRRHIAARDISNLCDSPR